MYIMDRKTELCSGNCGKVMLKTDMTLSCYDDLYCNDCMSTFISEQGTYFQDMVGGDDPCDY